MNGPLTETCLVWKQGKLLDTLFPLALKQKRIDLRNSRNQEYVFEAVCKEKKNIPRSRTQNIHREVLTTIPRFTRDSEYNRDRIHVLRQIMLVFNEESQEQLSVSKKVGILKTTSLLISPIPKIKKKRSTCIHVKHP